MLISDKNWEIEVFTYCQKQNIFDIMENALYNEIRLIAIYQYRKETFDLMSYTGFCYKCPCFLASAF